MFLSTWDGFLGESLDCLRDVNLLVMFDEESRMALEPMQGNRASSRVDLGYTELFHIAVVTSVSH